MTDDNNSRINPSDDDLRGMLNRFDLVGTREMTAQQIGFIWATKFATFTELWATEQLLHDLYDVGEAE